MGLAVASNHGQRSRFRLRRLCDAQLERLRGLLHGLLPASVARAMLRLSARPPPEACQAAVLQLDICKFTVMSQVFSLVSPSLTLPP